MRALKVSDLYVMDLLVSDSSVGVKLCQEVCKGCQCTVAENKFELLSEVIGLILFVVVL